MFYKQKYKERHCITQRRPTDKILISLWREVGIKKANGFCEYPGCRKAEHLNAHHIYSRSRKSVRWDTDNCIILCPLHHSLGNDSAHKSPDFKQIIISAGVRTKEFWDKLEMRAKNPAKIDMNLIKIDILQQLNKLTIEENKRLLTPYKVWKI